ncbi:hypothetical protein MOK15_19655 [Sphingobium sp. BYY-5]|uniref:hypothetical protein n=1 Tax=Sphingobium sp. BYY-5 TaxID=2926400 RepID=UPI001FA814C2|nr:hypothetical protein [Sphingobium sp. BYY-5]MCI4592296.1 hypothetical protein [Sphingobium sp. BYY-5]
MVGTENAVRLLEPLISGIVENPLWSTFLKRLQDASGADYVSLVFRPLPLGPERNRVIHLYSGRPSPPVVSQLYRDSLHVSDPMPYRDMTDGKVYTLAELLRFGDPGHEEYRSRLLVPSGMNVLRMMRVIEPSGISAWLTLSRSEVEFDMRVERLISKRGLEAADQAAAAIGC